MRLQPSWSDPEIKPSRLLDDDSHGVFIDAIITVAKKIPSGSFRLPPALAVRSPCFDRVLTGLACRPDILPLPPGKGLIRTDKFGCLPSGTVIDGHLDGCHVPFAGIGGAQHNNRSLLQALTGQGLGNNGFQVDGGDRITGIGLLTFLKNTVNLVHEEPFEWLFQHRNAIEPLHAVGPGPSQSQRPQRVAVL